MHTEHSSQGKPSPFGLWPVLGLTCSEKDHRFPSTTLLAQMWSVRSLLFRDVVFTALSHWDLAFAIFASTEIAGSRAHK